MAAGKTSQSNTSLVALVVFIILFLFCAIAATIFYTKFEDQKALTAKAEEDAAKMANRSEQNMLESKIVGPAKQGKSYIGTMSTYLDQMIRAIVGVLPEANAATKVNDTKIEVNKVLKELGLDATAVFGEKGVDLLKTIRDLKDKIDAARKEVASNNERIKELKDEIDLNFQQYQQEKEQLIAAKNKAEESEQEITKRYDELKNLWDKSSDEQMQIWADKLETAKNTQNQQKIEIVQLTDKLEEKMSQLNDALEKLESIKSTPEKEIIAYEADAVVFTADLQNGLVYLNIGLDDHAFPGLTFSIFDRNSPIPKDGKGKAEIEVFRVQKSSSIAKILSSSKKDPIIKNDIAVNMIWNSKTSNKFMVIGEFDFDGNGLVDRKGKEKIKQMIKGWNGQIVEDLTIDTDFVVVGKEPEQMARPTIQQIERDPRIEQEYEQAIKEFNEYQEIIKKADMLAVPVFNRKRFMHLTGYETTAERSTPVSAK